MARWQALPKSLDKRQANGFDKGLDTETSPIFVDDNSMVNGDGWDFDQYPAIKVRDGKTVAANLSGGKVRLMANYGDTAVMAYSETGGLYYFTDFVNTNITGSIVGGDALDWDSTNFDISGPSIIMLNGVITPRRWDGTTLGTIAAMPTGARYITSDNLRVFTATGNTLDGDVVYYSAFQDALDWSTPGDSGAVQFYTDLGGPITALKSFQDQIWIFKNNAFALLFHTGDASINYRLRTVANDIGCISHKTIVDVGEYLIWLGETDVYAGYNGAALPIGRQLRKYLDRINRTFYQRSFAFTDDERYYLFFPIDDAQEPNVGFVYDLRFRRWLPYDINNVNNVRVGTKFMQSGYAGNQTGTAYKMNNGTTDAGVAVPYSVESKPFDDGVKECEKELYHAYVQGTFPTGSTLIFEVAADDLGTTWYPVSFDPSTLQAEVQNKRLIVPLDVVPLCHFYKYRIRGTGPVTIDEVQRYSRIQPVQL